MRGTQLFHVVVNARAISRPAYRARGTRKISGPQLLASAAVIHQVKARYVVRVVLLVVADISDPFPIGRNLRAAVRSLAVGQWLNVERLQIDGVNLAVAVKILGIGLSNRRNINRLPVGGPFGRAVVILARGNLARGPAERGVDRVHLSEAHRQRTSSVGGPCVAAQAV